MNNAAIGPITARRLLEQFGLLTLPLKEKKRPERKAKPAAEKTASGQPSPIISIFRRHI
jgi:hypothetical protein